MLVNNPMGSRRRRRFYHRAGVVPIPNDLAKDEFNDPNFLNYELEPFEYSEEEEFKPTSSITQGGKRRVNFITVTSLHTRLLEIIDSMIALAEAEDREKAKQEETDQASAEGVEKDTAQKTAQQNAEEEDSKVVESSNSKAE